MLHSILTIGSDWGTSSLHDIEWTLPSSKRVYMRQSWHESRREESVCSSPFLSNFSLFFRSLIQKETQEGEEACRRFRPFLLETRKMQATFPCIFSPFDFSVSDCLWYEDNEEPDWVQEIIQRETQIRKEPDKDIPSFTLFFNSRLLHNWLCCEVLNNGFLISSSSSISYHFHFDSLIVIYFLSL